MEWWVALVITLGGFLALMCTGMPIFLAFLLVNVIGVLIWWGGAAGLEQMILSMRESVASFTYLPLVMFVLMGGVMFESGIAPEMMTVVDKWLGRLPGRLSLLAVASGTLLATLSGSSIASTALLGKVLVPEMEKRGYKKPMTLGPIMGSGGLAILIPPSGVTVFLAALAEISVGRLLIATVIPALILGAIMAGYIIIRCILQPDLAPSYKLPKTSVREKLIPTGKYVVPLLLIIFLVTGSIFLGIATPTEAAALGACGAYVLAIFYRKFNWKLVRNTAYSTVELSVIMLIILAGAKTFSQLMAYTGSTNALINLSVSLPVAPIVLMIAMQTLGLVLGTWMAIAPLVMITMPVFMPIVHAMNFDPIWFGAIYMLNLELSQISPPFGTVLFAMKATAPKDTTLGDVFLASIPFCLFDVIVMALMLAFPILTLWLPNMMRGGG